MWVTVQLCVGECAAVPTHGAWSWWSWQWCSRKSWVGPPWRSATLGYDPNDECQAYTWFSRFLLARPISNSPWAPIARQRLRR